MLLHLMKKRRTNRDEGDSEGWGCSHDRGAPGERGGCIQEHLRGVRRERKAGGVERRVNTRVRKLREGSERGGCGGGWMEAVGVCVFERDVRVEHRLVHNI